MIIVGISGKRGSGKTTLANILEERYGWFHVSLADFLKRKCREDFDLTLEQTNGALKEVVDERYDKTPRQIMIDMGSFYRSVDPHFWIKKVQEQILGFPQAQRGNVVISDIRFRNEAEWISRHYGYVVRLERSPTLNIYRTEIQDPSECELDAYSFYLTIPALSNVTLADLERIAGQINRSQFHHDTVRRAV